MADVTLTYKGATIAELNDSGSKAIRTAGKFCEADIGVEYVKPSGGGVLTGSFTPAANTLSVTIDALDGKSFTHFLCKMTGRPSSHLAGNTVRALCMCVLDLTPGAMNAVSVGTNNAGTALASPGDSATPTSGGPAYLSGNTLKTGASSSGGGYMIAGVTYEWFAW